MDKYHAIVEVLWLDTSAYYESFDTLDEAKAWVDQMIEDEGEENIESTYIFKGELISNE